MTKVDDLLGRAMAELGKPYVYGDEGPNTFDCSGLMQFVYGQVGIALPRTAEQQRKFATPVSSPLPGDLVFYGNPAHHVALFVGQGKQIAATHTGDVVRLQPVGAGATYGRVPTLGTAYDAVFSPLFQTTGGVIGSVVDWVTPARKIVLEAAVVGAGVLLVGLGLWRTVGKPQASRVLNEVESML